MNQNETYRVASTDLKTQYEYSNENVAINGTHNKDGNGQLNVLRGDVFAISSGNDGGNAVGSFSGYRRGNSMLYDTSGIDSSYLLYVSQAIISLEAIASANENQEGGEV